MAERQQALADAVLADPAVASLSSFIGVDGTNATLNSGRLLINLKPRSDRDSERRATSSAGCSRSSPRSTGITLYMQPVQDLTIEDRVSRTQYQFSVEDADPDELAHLGAQAGRPPGAGCRNSPTSRATCRTTACRPTSTSTATPPARLGVTPAADRQRALQRLRPAPGLDDLHAVQPVPRGARSASREFQQRPRRRSTTSTYLASRQRRAGAAVAGGARRSRSRRRWRSTTSASSRPPRCRSTSRRGASLGDAVKAIDAAQGGARHAAQRARPASRARRCAFQASLANTLLADPRGDRHDVHRARRALRELHPPDHDPVDAAVGRRRRAARAADLAATTSAIIAIIGIILLIGIVKKNAIMMIDFALDAERDEGKAPRDAIYQACLLRFRPILMTTMAALLGALPLMLGTGVGSELRHPLGITMVGGLIVSQVLTLFTTPVIYLAFDRLGARCAKPPASGAPRDAGASGLQRHEHLRALHRPAGGDHAADARHRAGRRARVPRCCRCRRCRRSTSRPSRCRRRCPAPARRPWPRPWRRRSSARSAASPASPR